MKIKGFCVDRLGKTTVNGVPIGQVFSGRVGDHFTIFLKAYDCIVDLNDPSKTWTGVGGLTVFDYRPLQAELVVLGATE